MLSYSKKETLEFGKSIGEKARPGDVFVISGNLGAGKTVIAQGLAKGLGVTERVTSPTFTLINEYLGGRLPFYHFDMYRLGEGADIGELGFDDYFYGTGVCAIEWGEYMGDVLPKHTKIVIERDNNNDVLRNIRVNEAC